MSSLGLEFTEISKLIPSTVHLQTFCMIRLNTAKSLSIVDLQTVLQDFVKSVNCESVPLVLAATFYKHFTNIF